MRLFRWLANDLEKNEPYDENKWYLIDIYFENHDDRTPHPPGPLEPLKNELFIMEHTHIVFKSKYEFSSYIEKTSFRYEMKT